MSQQELLKRVVRVLNDLGIEYMVSGSLVSSLQGEGIPGRVGREPRHRALVQEVAGRGGGHIDCTEIPKTVIILR
jgi:hypothetical protein